MRKNSTTRSNLAEAAGLIPELIVEDDPVDEGLWLDGGLRRWRKLK